MAARQVQEVLSTPPRGRSGRGAGVGLAGFPPPATSSRAEVRSEALPEGEGVLLWAVGAHGGAGATSLAARFGFVGDAGRQFPSGEYPGEDRVVVVAAETVAGLTAAQNLVLQHLNGLAGDTDLVAVVTHPVVPQWTGKGAPVEIGAMLRLLDDAVLPFSLVRLGWDGQLAVATPGEVEPVSPAAVAEWLAMDAKARRRVVKGRDWVSRAGLAATGARLLECAAGQPADPSPD